MDRGTPDATAPEDWVDEGLISFEQAEAIERGGFPWPPHRFTEALLYLGAAGFVIAVLIWYSDLRTVDWYSFDDPNSWGAFAVVIAGGAVLTGLAYVLNRDAGGIRRAVGVLLALAVLHVALAVSVAFEALDFYGNWAALINSLIVFAAALGAWWLRKLVPTEVALFGGASFVIVAIIALIQDAAIDPLSLDAGTITGTTAGVFMWLLGAVWLWLGYSRILRSANTAYLLGGATMVGAAIGLALGVNRWWVLLLGATAPALVAGGVYVKRTILMLTGVFGTLITVPVALSLWMSEPPAVKTWVMIYGIPGLLLLMAAMVVADLARRTPPSTAMAQPTGDSVTTGTATFPEAEDDPEGPAG